MEGQNLFWMKTQPRYTNDFRLKVIKEVLDKRLTLTEASKKYNIKGHTTISKWIKKYLNNFGEVKNNSYIGTNNSYLMTEKENTEFELLKQENEKLKQELSFASMRVIALETLIDLAEKDLKINLRKKCSTKQSVKSDSEIK